MHVSPGLESAGPLQEPTFAPRRIILPVVLSVQTQILNIKKIIATTSIF